MLEKQADFTIYENDSFKNYFDKHMYFFKYKGIVRNLIINYKFNEKSYLYKTFTNFFIKNQNFCDFFKSYDIIMPVPISIKRNMERGYNQSQLIAKELSKKLNIQLVNNCLIKNKNVIKQSKLSKAQRLENIQGAYKIRHYKKINNKKIILFDDIFTTGSTVNECCKMLYNAKPKEICVLTIAKD